MAIENNNIPKFMQTLDRCLRKMEGIRPYSFTGGVLLSRLYLDAGEQNTAESFAQEWLPRANAKYNELGNIYQQYRNKNDLNGGLSALKQFSAVADMYPWVDLEIARTYAKLGDNESAKKYFKATIYKASLVRELGIERADYDNEFDVAYAHYRLGN